MDQRLRLPDSERGFRWVGDGEERDERVERRVWRIWKHEKVVVRDIRGGGEAEEERVLCHRAFEGGRPLL